MMERVMAGYDTFPVEALNTLHFKNVNDGEQSLYSVVSS